MRHTLTDIHAAIDALVALQDIPGVPMVLDRLRDIEIGLLNPVRVYDVDLLTDAVVGYHYVPHNDLRTNAG